MDGVFQSFSCWMSSGESLPGFLDVGPRALAGLAGANPWHNEKYFSNQQETECTSSWPI
jgi:hypothetical protein